jgi:AcrR family transcriptional regulator
MNKTSEEVIFSKRQKQIIDVCIKLIADGGIQNLTTKHIAQKVGVSEPALYRHFESKLAILKAILEEFKYTSKKELLRINKSNENNLEKIKKIFLQRVETFSKKPELSNVIFSEEIFQNEIVLSESVLQIMNIHQQAILKLIEEAQEKKLVKNDIPAEHLCIFIMGSLRLLITRWRLMKFSFNLEKKAQELWNSIELMIKE